MKKRPRFIEGAAAADVSRHFTGIRVGRNNDNNSKEDKGNNKKMTLKAIIIKIGACLLPLILLLLLDNSTSQSDTTDKPLIEIRTFNSSHLRNQPTYYPWHDVANGSLNFSQLWELVMAEPKTGANSLRTDVSAFYIIKNGRLYERSNQHKAKYNISMYHGRIFQYEHLISLALAILRIIASKEAINERLQKLIMEPFPFYVIWVDFRACVGKTFPFFTFPTFAQPSPGQETCLPISMPTYEQFKNHKLKAHSNSWENIFKTQAEKYPWHSKINKAVWRGAPTGNELDWRDLPRSKLIKISRDNPSIMDASFTADWLPQRNETEKLDIISSGFANASIPFADFQMYKAIIDIDGNSWSSRFADLLCMNSVVIKVEPYLVDYFYVELQPWVHYIPVHRNMSNLVEMVNMVLDDSQQERMKNIVKQANDFCRSKLTATQMAIDMVWIMGWYVELLTREDGRSGNYTRWKQDFSNPMIWNSSDWIEILPEISG
jgi:hypothetical protein